MKNRIEFKRGEFVYFEDDPEELFEVMYVTTGLAIKVEAKDKTQFWIRGTKLMGIRKIKI